MSNIYFEIDGVVHESDGEAPDGSKIVDEKVFFVAKEQAENNRVAAMEAWCKNA